MAEVFQRLFARVEPAVLSVNVQAALGPARVPRRSQFSLLLRHFLERFFNHETASPDGDAKTRLVQIACAVGLPPFVVAIYLWPVYHPIAGWPPGTPSTGGPPPYWLQVNHHFFFVLYSFVATGIATVFEWDLYFPDQLDIFVLGTLPISPHRTFLARVAAIAIFVFGFLLVINVIAVFVLPMATDPVNLPRFLAAHVIAVATGGFFAAASILALQSLLVSALGERVFRRVALLLQAAIITLLVMCMLLFPVFSGVLSDFVQSGSALVRLLPPFWFLGVYQRLLEGPASLPIYASLAQAGFIATLAAAALAIAAYPLAYLRKLRQLVEGSSARRTANRALYPLGSLLHTTVVRPPVRRAVFHFISQTLFRVPRYRIYLVLYGGVGLSVVIASVLRFTVQNQQVRVGVSADGIRVAIGIVVFWTIAGLRMAFVSSGNQRGRWIFRSVHGSPPDFPIALEQLRAARVWVLLCSATVTCVAWITFRLVSPGQLLTWPATLAQSFMAAGMCLILADAFFLNVTTVPFTGEAPRIQPNLALTVLKYFTFFPLVSAAPLRLEPWIESKQTHLLFFALGIIGLHLYLCHRHRATVREHCNQIALEDDEEDFPMKLGLRY